jgi:zinc transport system ATP-binding protein
MDSAISVKKLNVSFDKNIILNDINFEVPAGSYMAVVGPNGSGKSTLLKTLLGLNPNYTGEIYIQGSKINSNLGKIAYVPQIKTLDRTFPAIVLDLVLSGLKKSWIGKFSRQDKLVAIEMLDRLSAANLADKQLYQLSGGELQRVYLARCLVTNPSILLLDEPATGVDLVCEKNVNQIINYYNKEYKTTVMMVTHDWSAAYHHTNNTLLLNKSQIYFGESQNAFTDVNLQRTFSHLGHDHGIKFGIKELSDA